MNEIDTAWLALNEHYGINGWNVRQLVNMEGWIVSVSVFKNPYPLPRMNYPVTNGGKGRTPTEAILNAASNLAPPQVALR